MWRGCVAGLVAAALAQASGFAQVRIEQVELGFNGRFFPGAYAPLVVTVSSAAARDFSIEASQEIRDSTGRRAVERVQVPVSLAPGARKVISFDVPIYSVSTPLQIRLMDGPRELARSTVEVRERWSETPLVLGVAVAPMASLELIDPEKLPKRWASYDGVGRIVWGRADPARMSAEQRRALQGWLVRGGELVVLSGEYWYEQASGWWAQLLPVMGGRVVRHQFNGHEVFWLEGELQPGAQVTLTYQGRPLVWERPVGNGRVVLVAIATLPAELKLSGLAGRHNPEEDLVIVQALGALTIPSPSRELVGVLLVLFVIGVWLGGVLAARWPKMPLGVAVMALAVSGVLFGYQHSPDFVSERHSLDIGVIQVWTEEQLAWERSWYGVFFRSSREEQLIAFADIVSVLRPARQAARSEEEITRELLPGEGWRVSFHGGRDSVSFFRAERVGEPFVHCWFEGSHVRVSNRAPVALQDVIAYSGDEFYWLGTIPAQTELMRPLRERITRADWANTLAPERRRIWQQWGYISSKTGLIGWREDVPSSPIRSGIGERRTVLRLVLVEGG